jgi:hypothetical protein
VKIDIDLSDLFDEDGERIKVNVQEQIFESIVKKATTLLDKQIGEHVRKRILESITPRVNAALDAIIPALMDYEFQETSGYGVSKDKTTIRARMLADIERAMNWKNTNYDSEKNAYTRTVEKIVAEQMKLYIKKFDDEVNAKFVKEAFDYAVKKLSEKLGISS